MLFPKDTIGFMYHIVSDMQLEHALFYKYKDTSQFETDIRFIKKNFSVTDYRSVENGRNGTSRAWPRHLALLTFDDGYSECFHHIRPILNQHQIRGVFFVCSDWIDNRSMFFESRLSACISKVLEKTERELQAICLRSEYLGLFGEVPCLSGKAFDLLSMAQKCLFLSDSASNLHREVIGLIYSLAANNEYAINNEQTIGKLCALLDFDSDSFLAQKKPFLTKKQLRQLHDEGHTIGAHTTSHLHLNNQSDEVIEREIIHSCECVHAITEDIVPFAFPYDGSNVRRSLLEGIRRKYDFIGMFFDTNGTEPDVPFVLNRLGCDCPPARNIRRSNLRQLIKLNWSLGRS